jgi:hypothetical protein
LARGVNQWQIVALAREARFGGWGGIRTPGEREPTPVFKTGALNHSATHPSFNINYLKLLRADKMPELAPDWHRACRLAFVVIL